MRTKTLFLFLIILLILVSCKKNSKANDIRFSFKNISEHEITNMMYFRDNKYSCSYYSIAKMDTVPYLNPPQRIPKKVFFIWQIANGVNKEIEINIKDKYQKNFKGEIIYELSKDNINVVFKADK